MTRPLGRSIRLGCTGLNACSGGIGIFFQGSAWTVADFGVADAGAFAVTCELAMVAVSESDERTPRLRRLRSVFTGYLPFRPGCLAVQTRCVRWCGCSR